MILGIDEAGRGSVLGPLVVGAVLVESSEVLASLGLRDSKKISPGRRTELAAVLRGIATVATVTIPSDFIDIERGREKGALNKVEVRAFATLIDTLLPDTAYLDACDTSEEHFAREIINSLRGDQDVVEGRYSRFMDVSGGPDLQSGHFRWDDIGPPPHSPEGTADVVNDREGKSSGSDVVMADGSDNDGCTGIKLSDGNVDGSVSGAGFTIEGGWKTGSGITFPTLVSRHGADDHFPVVSAASIIAKTRRDEEVERISEALGCDVGSGYPSDPLTVSFLEGYLEENGTLPPFVRASWKSVKRIQERRETRTLWDF